MIMATDSEYSVPFWAHELSNFLAFHFRLVQNPGGEFTDFFEDFNAPASPVMLTHGAMARPVEEHIYYHCKPSSQQPGKKGYPLAFSCIQFADTLAWRVDVHEAWVAEGWHGVAKFLAKPAYQTEKLRGQAQLANNYLWYPMPKELNLEVRCSLSKLSQLRFVCRRRHLVPEEILYANAFNLYVVLCRPSHSDVLKRAEKLGLTAQYGDDKYSYLSNQWGVLDECGLVAGVRPIAKSLRAYIKHLTD